MRLVGSEERALWSAAAVAAFDKTVPVTAPSHYSDKEKAEYHIEVPVQRAAMFADAFIVEYRRRCG